MDEPKSSQRNLEEDEAVEIANLSALDCGMEDVKELKRLLYLAKMKFRKNNPDVEPPKSFKIKRKPKLTRKVKTGYMKKRGKYSRDQVGGNEKLSKNNK